MRRPAEPRDVGLRPARKVPGMYRLPDRLRAELNEPLAPVLADEAGVARARDVARAGGFVVAVGDVTTERLLAGGVVPRVMVLDHRTKRGVAVPGLRARLDEVAKSGVPTVRVRNPAATVTSELWDALVAALAADAPTVVEVEGEEDLAALPAVLLAPEGAVVCYGQPDKGMVVVPVNREARERVRLFLSQMEP